MIRFDRSFVLLALLVAALSGALTDRARALSCSASISTPINFGSVDVLSGGAVSTEGTLTVTCSVSILDLTSLVLGVAVCPGIGNGSGGATSGGRLLVRDGGTETLLYQLTTDQNGQSPWGGYSGGLLFGDAPLFRIPASVGTVSGNWPIYAVFAGGQPSALPGVYRSNFTGLGGTGTEIRYGSLGSLLGCSSLGAANRTSANFTVQATVNKNCLVTTEDVDFGTHGLLAASVEAEGAIDLTCTRDTAYTVELENGALPASQRQMKNGAHSVFYALFQDSSHMQLWGSNPGEVVSGGGSATSASIPVYGLVPPQATPPSGIYKDTVIVTITY